MDPVTTAILTEGAAFAAAIAAAFAVAKSYYEAKKARHELEKLKREQPKIATGAQIGAAAADQEHPPEQQHRVFQEWYLEYVARETGLIALPRVTFGYPRIALSEVFVGLGAAVTTIAEGQMFEPMVNQPHVPDDHLSLVRAVLQAKHVVLLGEQGSGKSTLLAYIANACTLPNASRRYVLGLDAKLVPVIIRCHELSEIANLLSLPFSAAVAALQSSGHKLEWPNEFWENLMKDERLLVMFDGLDEIVDEPRRSIVATWIDGLISLFGRNRFVVASRPFAHHATPVRRAATEIILRELDDHRVSQLVQRLWSALPQAAPGLSVNELLFAIEADAGLRRIAASPLLLSMLTLVAHRTGNVPRPGMLYKQLIETLLHRDIERGISWPGVADEDHARNILSLLAFAIQEAGRPTLTIPEAGLGPARETTATSLIVSSEVLAVLALRTGLIQVSESAVGFSHSLIRAYFAAYFLDRFQPDAPQFLTSVWRNGWWRDVLLAFAARGRCRELLNALKEVPDDLFLRRLWLEADCASEAEAGEEIAESVGLTSHLLQVAFAARYIRQRRDAQRRVAMLASPSMVDELVRRAVSGNSEVERTATDILSQADPAIAYQAILELARFARWSRTRVQLLSAVGRMTDADGRLLLLQSLRDPDSPDVRAAAAAALGRPTNSYAIPALLQALTTDSDSDVRRKAAESLSRIVDFGPDVQIVKILLDEDDWLVRARLVTLLQRDTRTLEAQLVSELSGTGASDRRWKAAEALGYIRTATAERVLARELRTDQSGDVRRACAAALSGTRDPVALNTLLQSIKVDELPEVRAEAAGSLYLPDDREARFLMRCCTEEASASVAAAIARALGRIRSPVATDLLLDLINDVELPEEVRETAADALARGPRPGIAAVLIERLTSDISWRVRSRCASALGGQRSPEAIAALCKAITSDESLTVRAWAIESIRAVESPEVSRVIMEASLNDPDIYVRWRGIESLRFVGGPEPQSLLIRIAKDASEPIELRLIALQTAAYYSDPDLLQQLLGCLHDPDVQDYAYDALERMTESVLIPPQVEALGPEPFSNESS